MITDLDAGLLCYSSYFAPADFDKYETGENTDGVQYGLIKHADCYVVCFRGSVELIDWERNFQADMTDDVALGQVHRGFTIGLPLVLEKVTAFLEDPTLPVIVTGHSLGAARAILFGAMLILTGKYNVTTIGLEPPRAGGDRLTEIYSGKQIRLYRNNADPVTDVPVALPHWPYQHAAPLIPIKCEPIAGDPAVFFRDHHIQNVIVALTRHIGGYNA